IPVDGHIVTSKDHQLSSMAFNIWYNLYVEQAKEFKVTVRSKGKIFTSTVKAVDLQKLQKNAIENPVNKSVLDLDKQFKSWRKEPLHLEVLPDQKAAILTVLSFSVDMTVFRNKIDSLFRVIVSNKTEKLII